MDFRRSQYKRTLAPRRLTYGVLSSRLAATNQRFMRGRIGRTSRSGRIARYRRLGAGAAGGVVPYRQYLNAGPKTSKVTFTKSIATRTVTGAGASLGALSSFSLTGITPGAYGGVTFQNNFAPTAGPGNGLSEVAALRTLYELYKIKEICVRFRLNALEFTDGEVNPRLYITTVSDLTPVGATNPTSISYFDSLENVTVHTFTNSSQLFEYRFRPKIQVPAFTNATWIANNVGYSAMPSKWLDLSDASDVQHYGLAYFFTNIPTGNQIEFDIEFTFDCKKNQ